LKNKSLLKLIKIIPFIPLLIYLGERSLIAYDEGFYVLQSRWILENNNWIAPYWWGNIYVDRTIGIQYLLALSQKIFGGSFFSIYVPNIIGGSLTLFFTYKIHKEIFNPKNAIISPLILATTYLWINYYHMATQDIIFSSLVCIGIFSAIKSYKSKREVFFTLSGCWIGLAFMMKTYLVVIPFLGLLPFYIKNNNFKNKFFYLGFLIGFLPFLIWSYQLITIYGLESFNGLFSKFITLSKNNNFTNPFYYYLWNLPLNTFPWFVFYLMGIYKVFNFKSYLKKYFLLYFPFIVIISLSFFSTKTPYYTLQILPLLSINAYIGINYIFNEGNKLTINFKKIIFILFPSILIIFLLYINYFSIFDKLDNEKILLFNFSLCLFIFSWISIPFIKNINKKIFLTILGPYFLFTIFVQTGMLSDRSKDIRLASSYIIKKEMLSDQEINFITEGIKDPFTTKQLIKISLLMPKVGNGIKNIENLEFNQYAWTCLNEKDLKEKLTFRLIYEDPVLSPWKLIYKNKD
tara:strand:- start:7399 stop:8952 length:1554 start_codon:yes stop_codon:yes gene_type:complete